MPTMPRPTLTPEHAQALQTAAVTLAAQGQLLEARQAAEAAMVTGFSGPSLLLVHALCCARLGDVATATESVDAAVEGAEGLDAKSRELFERSLANVRAAMTSGRQGADQRQLAKAARDIYGA